MCYIDMLAIILHDTCIHLLMCAILIEIHVPILLYILYMQCHYVSLSAVSLSDIRWQPSEDCLIS